MTINEQGRRVNVDMLIAIFFLENNLDMMPQQKGEFGGISYHPKNCMNITTKYISHFKQTCHSIVMKKSFQLTQHI